LCNNLHKNLTKKRNKIADKNEVTNIVPHLESLALDIAGVCAFGYEINTQTQDHSPYTEV
jgi:hypothetical protein